MLNCEIYCLGPGSDRLSKDLIVIRVNCDPGRRGKGEVGQARSEQPMRDQKFVSINNLKSSHWPVYLNSSANPSAGLKAHFLLMHTWPPRLTDLKLTGGPPDSIGAHSFGG